MSVLNQMKLLVNLAWADGKVADQEKKYIINIGRANGFHPDEILPLIEKDHEVVVPSGLSNDEKFEFLYNLVQLMKIDEKMYGEEIRFCSVIAKKLGYDPQVMFEMMLQVKNGNPDQDNKSELKKITGKFLTK